MNEPPLPLPPDRILTGLGLRLFAALCMATLAAAIKLAEARGATLVEIVFCRQTFAVPVTLAWIAAGPGFGAIRTSRLRVHIARTAVGLSAMSFNFATLLLLPLAEGTTLLFTVPIFATVLGALALGERTGWHRWTAVAVGFAGVLIVAQPGGGHVTPLGLGVGLVAGLLMATVTILLRHLGRTESAATIVFWFSLLSVPPLAIALLFAPHVHDAGTWAVLASLGLFGGAGQLALTAALRMAPVAVVMPMDYSQLLWATVYGWALFGTWPTNWTWLGAPVIIASGLYIAWREHRAGRPETPVTTGDTPA